MSCFNLATIFFIYLFSLSNLLIPIQYTIAQPNYVYHFCLGSNYTTTSKFQSNLNHLLSSLNSGSYSASISLMKNKYYNASSGRKPDIVYASLQCRGDVSFEDCQACVQVGTEEIKKIDRCPNSKQAIIWYNVCMMRYSNEYYFGVMQETPGVHMWNPKNVSNPDQFNPILGDLMSGLVTKDFSNSFAIGGKNLTNSTTKVYGLVQCTPDISSGSCNRCLLGSISDIPFCCDGKQAGRILRPSCNLRYDLDPFFNSTVTLPPLLSPPPPLIPPPPHESLPWSTNRTTPIFDKDHAPAAKGNNSPKLAISIIVPSVVVAVLSCIGFCFFCFWRKKRYMEKFEDVNDAILKTESLQFNFSTVSASTDSFSEANKLGQGGFGSVYKGTLSDRQEIAVKRLSKNSGQGEREFKNEVTLVAKLQHKNLVKLVGFSVAGEEKLLIYEFMPNASLDQFLFDPIKRANLNWERRYKIIGGIAKGLVYLHEESRLKIIHRDLKASNILLDIDMNPKIADFGMARLFVLDQTQASTIRIVGTHGYMAPEYIMHGKFSVKSDVFSFGVLVLEILSGQRNSSFHGSDIARNLLSYAWKLWKNGSAIEILDPTLKDACSRSEVIRCIHVALLCVQENIADRPTMPTVVQMLNNSVVGHDSPSLPGFFAGSTRHTEPRSTLPIGYSEEQGTATYEPFAEAVTWSVNEASITEFYPR